MLEAGLAISRILVAVITASAAWAFAFSSPCGWQRVGAVARCTFPRRIMRKSLLADAVEGGLSLVQGTLSCGPPRGRSVLAPHPPTLSRLKSTDSA